MTSPGWVFGQEVFGVSGAVAFPLLLVAGLGVVIHPFCTEVCCPSPSVLHLERRH